mmetsp:Transcript_10760/g.17637  ORF Transcript_10760/g.17637 Transcript_10760/m.17637 type:complete len:284 (-) Transcript_10760:41-892(-)
MSKVDYGSIGPGSNVRRDMNLARMAYEVNDVAASINAHQRSVAVEGHREDGDSIKSIVYGGLDGVLTAFAIISGAAGGSLSPTTVLVLGVSNIFADAFAMGVGDTVSTIAYHEHVAQERRRECWEFENYPEGEIEEMIELYEQRGLPKDKASVVVNTMAKYKEFFIDIMMCEELQLKVPDERDDPYKDGFVTFLSFLIFGMLPLAGYILCPLLLPSASSQLLFGCACVITMVVLFSLGAFKSKFSASTWYYSGFEFLALGSAAALTSYFIGLIVKELSHDYFN